MENQNFNDNGKFAKGNTIGGRKKGSLNKSTSEVREFFADILRDNQERIISDLDELDPKERLRFLIDVAKLVLPALKAIEFSNPDDEDKRVHVIIRNNWNGELDEEPQKTVERF